MRIKYTPETENDAATTFTFREMPFRVDVVPGKAAPINRGSMSGIHKNLIMAEMTFRRRS